MLKRKPSFMMTVYMLRPSLVSQMQLLLAQWLGYLKETRLRKTILCDDSVYVKTIPCLTDVFVISTVVKLLERNKVKENHPL